MVEFALVAPILFGLMFGVFYLGVVYLKHQQVGFSASEAARCAAVARDGNRPACAPTATSPESAARSRARSHSPNLGLTDADITVTSPTGYAVPGTVTVTVEHDVTVPLLGWFVDGEGPATFELRSSSTAKLES